MPKKHRVRAKGRSYRGLDSKERRQVRRGKLIDAGVHCFGTLGYAATSVKAVCVHAGLTERYFYESFSDREALFRAVYDHVTAELENRMRMALMTRTPDFGATARAVLAAMYGFMKDDRRRARIVLFEVLGVSPGMDRRYHAGLRALARLVDDASFGLFPPKSRLAPSVRTTIALGLVGAAVMIAHEWALDNFSAPLDEAIDACLTIYLAVAAQLERGGAADSTRSKSARERTATGAG